PIGPDLAEPLTIASASLGLLVAVYTGAAALAGLLAARVLDRFDRRSAMLPLLLTLALANVAGSLAPSFAAMLAARALAGLCAAPLMALVQSLIADEIASEARGRALGVVMSGNAVAAVVGVPTCLWLAERVDWRLAFAAVAATALIVSLLVDGSARAGARLSAPERATDPRPSTPAELALQRRAHALIFVAFASAFALTPNLSAYVQFNLGYPRSDIPRLYMIAGCCSFVGMRVAGPAVDRWGSARIGSLAVIALALTVGLFLAVPTPLLAIEPAFIVMLVALGGRNVAVRALAARIPGQRGRFMALQSTAQQLGAVAGVLLGMALLRDRADGSLAGMPALACCSIALLAVVLPLLWLLEIRPDGQIGRASRRDSVKVLSLAGGVAAWGPFAAG